MHGWKDSKDCDPFGIWKMEETGCFFKALPKKDLGEKMSQARGDKKSKTRLTIAFFGSAVGESVSESVAIWRSAKPRCFKNLINPKHPYDVHYYSNQKSWMTSEIIDSVLTKISRKIANAKRNVLLSMDNVPCHPENFVVSYSNMKVVFYLKTLRPLKLFKKLIY